MRSSRTGSSGSCASNSTCLVGTGSSRCDDQCSYACVAIKNKKTGANRRPTASLHMSYTSITVDTRQTGAPRSTRARSQRPLVHARLRVRRARQPREDPSGGTQCKRAPRRRPAGGEGAIPPRPPFFLTASTPRPDLVCAELHSASPVPPEGECRSRSRGLWPTIRSPSAAGRQGAVRQRAAALGVRVV